MFRKTYFLQEADQEIKQLTVEKIQKVIDDQDRENMDKFFPKINE